MELSIEMILTLLQSEYPHSFASMDSRTMALKRDLWKAEFRNDDINLVYAAVRLYMKRPEEYAPSIGQVRENMNFLLKSTGHELSDQDAWVLVSKACANGLHHAREEFEKLPPEVQKAVGSPEQLKAWARMDEETVQSVVSSNFKKTFRVTQERAKTEALIPQEVKAFVAGIAERMKIGGGTTEQKAIRAQQPAALPAALKPMRAMPKAPEHQQKEPAPVQAEYKPLTEEEWEKKREEMLQKLAAGGIHG